MKDGFWEVDGEGRVVGAEVKLRGEVFKAPEGEFISENYVLNPRFPYLQQREDGTWTNR